MTTPRSAPSPARAREIARRMGAMARPLPVARARAGDRTAGRVRAVVAGYSDAKQGRRQGEGRKTRSGVIRRGSRRTHRYQPAASFQVGETAAGTRDIASSRHVRETGRLIAGLPRGKRGPKAGAELGDTDVTKFIAHSGIEKRTAMRWQSLSTYITDRASARSARIAP